MLNAGFCQETGRRIWLSYPGEGFTDLRLFCLIILLLLLFLFSNYLFACFTKFWSNVISAKGKQKKDLSTRPNEKQPYITQPSFPMRCTGLKISRALSR